MAFSELLCIVGCLAIVFAKVSWLLDVARLLNGIGIGILSYVLMICFGVSLIWIVRTIIHWRILALIGMIPSMLQFLGVFFIPESPRWLAKNSRWEDREDVLKYLRGQYVDTSAEADEIRVISLFLFDMLFHNLTLKFHKIITAVSRFSFNLVLVGVGLMVFQQFGGVNGVVFYATSIFESAGRVGTLALVATTVPMTVTGTVLMDRPGRRPLLMVSDFCSWILLRSLLDRIVVLVLAPILALDGVLIFPMNVKGLVGSLVTVVNWLGSWIISFAFNFLMNWSSS
ncbi:Sugar transporter ERD6-like 5, partial [Bienertia sinuspersici]